MRFANYFSSKILGNIKLDRGLPRRVIALIMFLVIVLLHFCELCVLIDYNRCKLLVI